MGFFGGAAPSGASGAGTPACAPASNSKKGVLGFFGTPFFFAATPVTRAWEVLRRRVQLSRAGRIALDRSIEKPLGHGTQFFRMLAEIGEQVPPFFAASL